MKILFFGNNWIGWQVMRALVDQGDEIVGAVLHADQNGQFRKEIVESSGLSSDKIFDGANVKQADFAKTLASLGADMGVSALFRYRIPGQVLRIFPKGAVNLHPSYLPFNKGVAPNVFSIIDGTPAGVTIHYMDEALDTGDLVAQAKVLVEPQDTGERLYRKLEVASVELFKETWPAIKQGEVTRTRQNPMAGAYHSMLDFDQLHALNLDDRMSAQEWINLVRALTFPPHKGAYFVKDGKKYFLELRIEEAK